MKEGKDIKFAMMHLYSVYYTLQYHNMRSISTILCIQAQCNLHFLNEIEKIINMEVYYCHPHSVEQKMSDCEPT